MTTLAIEMSEQDRQISNAVEQQRSRLRNFIRRRISDPSDIEDILQDVFSELVEAYRLMKPIEQAGAWLFQVARNRIIDQFRKKRPQSFSDLAISEGEERLSVEDLLASPDAGPEAAYARSLLLEELEAALDELPVEQRQAFVAHEIDGRSFQELADETGVGVNTLISRKRYAVLHLRRKLRAAYEELLG